MGTKFAPSYCDVYMALFEEQFLNKTTKKTAGTAKNSARQISFVFRLSL